MKGAIHTLEAILGSVLILVGIIMIFPNQQSEKGFSNIGYSCLNYLDQKGLLRQYATSDDTDFNNSLKSCLPSTLDFKYKVCESTDCKDTTIPYNKTVYLSSYLIAGENTFNKRIINLWIWSK